MANFFDGLFGQEKKKKPAMETVTGFDPREFTAFMQAAGSVASRQTTQADPTLQQREIRVRKGAASPFVSVDQSEGLLESFARRKEEVFGRRARPGISQTRLV